MTSQEILDLISRRIDEKFNFNAELKQLYDKVKSDYQAAPFATIRYPEAITAENWCQMVREVEIPPVWGNVYFIFDGNKQLLYIGRTQQINAALKSHLIKRTSERMSSILDGLKDLVLKSDTKRIYIKTIDVQPVELVGTFKSRLIYEFCPRLARRQS